MRYKTIDSKLFKKNREKFASKMPTNTIAIFNSNDLMPKNADQLMAFKQNSDLFYLSGIDQEETILIIIKHSSIFRSILFIRETNDTIKIWEGSKLAKNDAEAISGIDTIFWNTEFESKISSIMKQCNIVFLNSNEHARAVITVETRDARFKKWIKVKFPKHIYKKAADMIYPIRAIKGLEEVSLIQKACDITKIGVSKVISTLKPGIYEYEIEAEIIREFLLNKSRGFAYDPIIASGSNACILHYGSNNEVCKDGDVVLMDFGAEYANYASDLTRCFPVNGRFTKRQKKIYNAVLNVMKQSKNMLKQGIVLSEYEKEVGSFMEKELVDLGLISSREVSKSTGTPAYKKYYMHGTSHHLGLDVHDVSGPNQILSEGMVLTCEPGIYVPEEGIGIRLENDILITSNGHVDLMSEIPIEADEIEELMNI